MARARLKGIATQLRVTGGLREEGPPNLAVIEEPFSLRRSRGDLYIALEVTGEVSTRDDISRQLIGLLEEEFYSRRGSITASLSEAIKAANNFLLDENLHAPPPMQRTAGLTCLVHRDEDLFIGQAGPALTYVAQQGKWQRFPAEPPWLERSPPSEIDYGRFAPLGVKKVPEILLFHCHLQPGDNILLTFPSLAQQIEDQELAAAVIYEEPTLAVEKLASLAGTADFSAMVIEIAAEEEPAEERARPLVKERELPLPLAWGAALANRGVGAVQGIGYRLAKVNWRGLLGFLGRFAVGLGRLILALLWLLATMLGRTLPEREEAEEDERIAPPQVRPSKAGRRARGGRALILIGLLIPVLTGLLVLGIMFQVRRSRQAHFGQLLTEAAQAHQTALVSDQRQDQRKYLSQALEKVHEALELNPADEEAKALRDKIEAALDVVNAVSRLSPAQYRMLVQFDEPGSTPGPLVVHGIDIYVLDRGLDRIYKYLLNETRDDLQRLDVDPILMRRGDERGPIVVRDLLDIFWMEAGSGRSNDGLFILEGGRNVLEYHPARGLMVLTVLGAQDWRQPALGQSYFGNLYVLDPQLNRIFKHLPTGEDYRGGAGHYLASGTTVDLAGAVDMAIDGFVYVLLADGTILKFDKGQLLPFTPTGLDKSLSSPTALHTSPATQSLYVADADNQRIVQFDKEGNFQRQFRADDPSVMAALTGLFVDEAGQRLYFVSDNKLYLA
ncbi:MAG: hypothetical protein ACE5NP_12290, partial [Anaerolineae bacterium]